MFVLILNTDALNAMDPQSSSPCRIGPASLSLNSSAGGIFKTILNLNKMKFDEYQEKLCLLKKLVERSNTGSPRELAKTLNVSERTARRFVEKLKLRHPSIMFCRRVNSYILNE